MVQRSLGGGEVHGCEVPLRFKATHICQRVEGSPNKFHVLLTMVGTCHSLTRRPATLCARNFLRPLSMQVMRRQSIERNFEEEAAIDMFAVGVVPSWQLILLPAFAMPVNFPGAHEQCALMAAYVPRVKTCDIRRPLRAVVALEAYIARHAGWHCSNCSSRGCLQRCEP